MQASKSSIKPATALGGSASKSSTKPSARPRALAPAGGPVGGLVGGRGPGLEIGPGVVGHLGRKVPHAMDHAALAGGPGKGQLDRLDDAGRPARDDEQPFDHLRDRRARQQKPGARSFLKAASMSRTERPLASISAARSSSASEWPCRYPRGSERKGSTVPDT